MPKNYFKDRDLCTMYSDGIQVGDIVEIILKEDQGTKNREDLIKGEVSEVLSKGGYYRNGIKVRLATGEVGRCQYLIKAKDSNI